eukprot:5858151-Pyramimonas_sp.AAC.1
MGLRSVWGNADDGGDVVDGRREEGGGGRRRRRKRRRGGKSLQNEDPTPQDGCEQKAKGGMMAAGRIAFALVDARPPACVASWFVFPSGGKTSSRSRARPRGGS